MIAHYERRGPKVIKPRSRPEPVKAANAHSKSEGSLKDLLEALLAAADSLDAHLYFYIQSGELYISGRMTSALYYQPKKSTFLDVLRSNNLIVIDEQGPINIMRDGMIPINFHVMANQESVSSLAASLLEIGAVTDDKLVQRLQDIRDNNFKAEPGLAERGRHHKLPPHMQKAR